MFLDEAERRRGDVMSDTKPTVGPDLPWLDPKLAPRALEDAGRRAFNAFNQAGALATEMAQAVLAKQQRIVDGEFRRFVERVQDVGRVQSGGSVLEKEAQAIRESIEATTAEMRTINEILLNGNRKMLELWLSCFDVSGGKRSE
jgi:hypothetical protein